MNRASVVSAAVALLCLGSLAQALTMDMVLVGDTGNSPDTRYHNLSLGGVDYAYRIGKYEITAGQYTEFLNAKARTDPYGLYNTGMANQLNSAGCNIQRSGSPGSYSYTVASDWSDRPVNYVGYWDACRFANWMHNGQGSGSAETGAYTLNGYIGTDGRTIARNPGARSFVPSEDEWYKAAYYKGGGLDAGYWTYPTRSDTAPANQVLPVDPGNSANYGSAIGKPYYRTNVGEFENSESTYGTFDQGGNVSEWHEGFFYLGLQDEYGAFRGIRGGDYSSSASSLKLSTHGGAAPSSEYTWTGFRIASTVPEPSSFAALVLGLVSLFGIRWRKA